MVFLWVAIGIVAVLIIVLLLSYICYRLAFYVRPRNPQEKKALELPNGKAYEPFLQQIADLANETANTPHENMSITSFDGLKLYGKYYELNPNAPIELMFHGYRGTAERDLAGAVQRCFKVGHSALIVDQRCSGLSEGNTITFGVFEHRDCLKWIDFMLKRFGSDVKIILGGISMGASTVLIAAGQPLPPNVIGVLADCGFSSAKDIIKKVIGEMGLPVNISYWFVKLGARLYGHFNLEETSSKEAVRSSKIPIIFFHGEDDDFVPPNMSRINYENCVSKKQIVTIKGAGHGLSYLVSPDEYLTAVLEFFGS